MKIIGYMISVFLPSMWHSWLISDIFLLYEKYFVFIYNTIHMYIYVYRYICIFIHIIHITYIYMYISTYIYNMYILYICIQTSIFYYRAWQTLKIANNEIKVTYHLDENINIFISVCFSFCRKIWSLCMYVPIFSEAVFKLGKYINKSMILVVSFLFLNT